MREIRYRVALGDDEDYLRTSIDTEGKTVLAFVAQYETAYKGDVTPVARYDTAHGRAHRDEFDRYGATRKVWLPEHLSFAEALQEADRDLRENWQRYKDRFLEGFS